MSTKENVAIGRRVKALERSFAVVETLRIVTTLEIYDRGDEPRCETIADVYEFAKLEPNVKLVERRADLDVLLDDDGNHLLRLDGDDPEFDALAEGAKRIDVIISCSVDQVDQILSDALITATEGGARAGKTRILCWWLFRQWLKRGHGQNEDFEREAVFWWIREDGEKLYAHGVRWLLALWPPEVFVGDIPGSKTRNPSLEMVDGSRIDFRHAHHSGRRAGTNLRSESVAAAVVDELSAILDRENWLEVLNRLGQTAGPLATAYTPTNGHWCEEDINKAAPRSGGAIRWRKLTVFDNPWWPLARVWAQFMRDHSLDEDAMARKVLPAKDQVAAARDAMTDPDGRRRHLGESQPVGLVLWREWDQQRFIVRDDGKFRDELVLEGRRLKNITGPVLGWRFGPAFKRIDRAGGKDFNINPGVAVVFQVFGDPERPVVLVLEEIADEGPTIRNAERIASLHPGLCLHCDPNGAMPYRHESHGDKSSTDAEELRKAGLRAEPANGWRKGKVQQLPQKDSIDVMHRAMRLGLLRVHSRCTHLLKALTDMRAKPDGTIAKTPGVRSISDQLSGYGDALRYGVWPVWQHFVQQPTRIAGT